MALPLRAQSLHFSKCNEIQPIVPHTNYSVISKCRHISWNKGIVPVCMLCHTAFICMLSHTCHVVMELITVFCFINLALPSLLFLVSYATQWRSWLRHWATSQKVTGFIPNCVIGIFHWHNPSGCTMALGSTQLTEMSTRIISWGVKAAAA